MDKEELCETLLNVFVKHYNTYNNTNLNMFNGISSDDDTNDMLEELFEHMHEYNLSERNDDGKSKLLKLSEINVEDYPVLFGLSIDCQVIVVCPLMLPILMHVAEKYVNANWRIVVIKYDINT